MTRYPSNHLERELQSLVGEHGIILVLYALIETCYWKADYEGLETPPMPWEDIGQWLAAVEAMVERATTSRSRGGRIEPPRG